MSNRRHVVLIYPRPEIMDVICKQARENGEFVNFIIETILEEWIAREQANLPSVAAE